MRPKWAFTSPSSKKLTACGPPWRTVLFPFLWDPFPTSPQRPRLPRSSLRVLGLSTELLQPSGVGQGEGEQVLGEELAEASLEAGAFAEAGHAVGAAGGRGPEQGRH